MSWNRKLWGVEVSGIIPNEPPVILGIRWMDVTGSLAYEGEPTRALLFTTRALARAYCRAEMDKYADLHDLCRDWKFRAV